MCDVCVSLNLAFVFIPWPCVVFLLLVLFSHLSLAFLTFLLVKGRVKENGNEYVDGYGYGCECGCGCGSGW